MDFGFLCSPLCHLGGLKQVFCLRVARETLFMLIYIYGDFFGAIEALEIAREWKVFYDSS